MNDVDHAVARLRRRLDRYPAERYPVQHATTLFHLGSALSLQGQLAAARMSLHAAAELFAGRLPVEGAKALNALGAVLRELGDLEQAAGAFRQARVVFATHGRRLEEGAATFNLGLVLRRLGRYEEALGTLDSARKLLGAGTDTLHTAAVSTERAAVLLELGLADQAVTDAEEALGISGRVGHHPLVGEAANVLGLSLMTLGRVTEAVRVFEDVVAAHPRGIRPGAYAMGKANLALALERSGEPAKARLTAAQALSVPEAPDPVRRQAEDILGRLGPGTGDLSRVVLAEGRDGWVRTIADDLARWLAIPERARDREAHAWLATQVEQGNQGVELAEALLGAALELPPEEYRAIVACLVAALTSLDSEDESRVRHQLSRAMVRFHLPQWNRLVTTFEECSAQIAVPSEWR